MNIRIINDTIAEGAVVRIGEVLHLSPSEARLLIALGKAVSHDLEDKEDREDVIETRPVVIQSRQPVTKGIKTPK